MSAPSITMEASGCFRAVVIVQHSCPHITEIKQVLTFFDRFARIRRVGWIIKSLTDLLAWVSKFDCKGKINEILRTFGCSAGCFHDGLR